MDEIKFGLDLIKEERESQITRGYTIEIDKHHTDDELMKAAYAHMLAASGYELQGRTAWPFDLTFYRLNTPISSLAKAGALLAAEIDRRLAAGEEV